MKRREPQIVTNEESTEVAALPPASSPTSGDKKNSPARKSGESLNPTLEPRRSTRVSTKKYSHDGDSWQETLAVCEMPKKDSGAIKMIIRSYYSNQRTGERVWDEPPSGASRVMPATEEMRKMAEVQLQEMQITFGGVASEQPESKEKPKIKGLFRRNKAEKEDVAETPRGKLQYKPGSFLARVKESPNKVARDDTLDPELQKAIALSMADGGIQRLEANQDSLEPVIRSEVAHYRDDEETLQMAMALSLSEAECTQRLARLTEDEMLRRASKRVALSSNVKADSHVQLSEEEMLEWALEESQRSTTSSKVASLPVDDAMSCSTDDNSFRLLTKKSSDDFSDKKMPAEPSMKRGALGQSVRKKPPVGRNEPRSYELSSSAGTNDSRGSKPRSYERSSTGGSRRQQAKNESIARETVHVIPGSPERSARIGSSRRVLSKNDLKD
jgi:hypothetical protein